MKALGARLTFVLSLILLVGCDHGTKYVAKAGLQGHHPHTLIRGVLDLQYVEHTDVAFDLLRWIPEGARGPILIFAGAAGLVALAAFLLRRPPRSRAGQLALLLVTAGALGNYLDRIVRGYVVDFIHLHHWPVFNVADSCVTIGAILLGLTALRGPRATTARPAPG
ncbi:MAG TPA: signal peptidase II [Polyangia bacterium]|nr:signal peptidase II [Polyangia bacterium]